MQAIADSYSDPILGSPQDHVRPGSARRFGYVPNGRTQQEDGTSRHTKTQTYDPSAGQSSRGQGRRPDPSSVLMPESSAQNMRQDEDEEEDENQEFSSDDDGYTSSVLESPVAQPRLQKSTFASRCGLKTSNRSTRHSRSASQTQGLLDSPPSQGRDHGASPTSNKDTDASEHEQQEAEPRTPRKAADLAATLARIELGFKEECCNCGKAHDVHVCPYPNTEDGRLKVCFSCDTTDHAWFQCPDHEQKPQGRPEFWEEFLYLWKWRTGLCCVVHDRALHGIYRRQAHGKRGKTLFNRPGPLRPAFVQRMMRYAQGADDTWLRYQIFDWARALPWDVPDEILITGRDRETAVINDPHTRRMKKKTWIVGADPVDDVPDLDFEFMELMMA